MSNCQEPSPLMGVFLLVFCMHAVSLTACTVFVMARNGAVLAAKNLDWPVGEGVLVVNGRGVNKVAFAEDPGIHVLTWRSRFGSATVNLLGREFPLGGINERGLVIEEASYSPSRYPRGHGPVVNEFQWIQYHLDTCADTAEVLASLERIRIVPILARLHYLVCDAAGRAALVEFIAGKVRVYTGNDLPVPVMTNTSYANSLKSLAIHRGFGGTRAVGDGPESPERFVRAALRIRDWRKMPGSMTADCAFRVLNTVAQRDTQWAVVYDPVNLVLQFRTRGNPSIRALGLKNCDFQRTVWTADMNVPGRALERKEWTFPRHTLRIKDVFARLVRQGEAEAASAIALRDRLIAYAGTLP